MPSINFDHRQKVQHALGAFTTAPLKNAATQLLDALGYASDKTADLGTDPQSFLASIETFRADLGAVNRDKVKADRWQTCAFLFQLTNDEIPSLAIGQAPLGTDNKLARGQIESFVFLSIELQGEDWSRTQLATISRELNKRFPMPGILLFKHGGLISLAVIDRRQHLRDASRDVIDSRITVIKDVRTANPHRAHIDILASLALEKLGERRRPSNFRELYDAWIETLSTQALNKRFYTELAWWYLWAVKQVDFPHGGGADAAKRNSVAVIRLLTRLIFIWFIKEKGLVLEALFERSALKGLLKADPGAHGDDSNYYRAILQNLFFATLNVEMGADRKWAQDGSGMKGDRLIHSLYRHKELFEDADAAFDLFAQIPFLNGGLFECLDRDLTDLDFQRNPELRQSAVKEGNGWVLRVDGFSRRQDAQPTVPNKIFFGGEVGADLNADLGTRGKCYDVHGLLDIFARYKFTVDENTSLEEEVALDPELLGKVFENLLASFNEDTQNNARKQSGSFYTPREVVDYMVDEALIAYFDRHLPAKAEREQGLRSLLSYTAEGDPFDAEETAKLIAAIERLNILDPACGSGAFPMGILNKLVHVLRKLDPGNELWKAQNRAPLAAQLVEAKKIPDINLRQTKEEEAEAALVKFDRDFANDRHADYTRKLYLIEKCIHGVDIQPIAVQIAKLRFFIALVVSQEVDRNKGNWGITPLPNLETKIVAADSLTPIDRPAQMGLRDPAIDQKEKELTSANEHYFAARTSKTKRKWRDGIFELRDEMAALLEEDRFLSPGAARQLVHWNPFDQNAAAEFFDPEWMFQLADGFDIIIGNPPYRQVKKGIYSENYFPFAEGKDPGKQNLYKLFIELSFNLLDSSGVGCLIVQSSLLCDMSSKHTRELLLSRARLTKVLEFPKKAEDREAQVFEGVLQGTSIALFLRVIPDNNHEFLISTGNDTATIVAPSFTSIKTSQIFTAYPESFNIPLIRPLDGRVIKKIQKNCRLLGSLIHRRESTKGDFNLGIERRRFSNRATPVKLIRGRNIHRYWIDYDVDEFIEETFKTDAQRLNSERRFLITQNITGTTDERRLHVAPTVFGERCLFGDTVNKILLKTENETFFTLGVLNSIILDWYFRKTSTNNHVNGYEIDELPIPNASTRQVMIIQAVVYAVRTSHDPRFEQLINGLVFELFFPDELHAANIRLFDSCEIVGLGKLNELKDEALASAAREYADILFAPSHLIYAMLYDLQGLDVVRIVEGRE